MARHQGPNYRPSFRPFLDFDPEGPINVTSHSPGASLSSSDIGVNRGLASSMGPLALFSSVLGQRGRPRAWVEGQPHRSRSRDRGSWRTVCTTENGKQEGATLDPLSTFVRRLRMRRGR